MRPSGATQPRAQKPLEDNEAPTHRLGIPGVSMYLGNLTDTDRAVARVVRVLSIVILGALMLSGIWQFFFHEANGSWARYELGSDNYLLPVASSGIAELHAALADLSGLLALFVVAWMSARVLHRVSWFALSALLLVLVSLYTGTLIRYNAVIESDGLITNTRGYSQLFLGSADGVVTDRFELNRLSIILWTLAHIASVPVLLLAASITIKRSEARRVARKGQKNSWLDTLPLRR